MGRLKKKKERKKKKKETPRQAYDRAETLRHAGDAIKFSFRAN
jgi:hypothetical protein